MIKDYYDILSLKHDASADEIAQQYKRLVLRWHPRFAKEDQKTAHFHFSQISEAYEVLSDPLKRAFYDRYGYLKLKEGLFSQGELKGGYRFADNPDEIFEKFFHQHNPLAQSVDAAVIEKGSLLGFAYGGLNYTKHTENEDLIVKVSCTLHELYIGVAKHVSYQRRVLNLDGRTTSLKKEERLLEIKPGFGSQTKIVMKGEGHDNVNRNTSNLIFKIVQHKHNNYVRKGNDLIYTQDITLEDALNSQSIQLTTLDNRILRIPIDEIISPSVLKEVPNEGIPQANGKGTLYIKFNILFPSQLPEHKKVQLRKLLQ